MLFGGKTKNIWNHQLAMYAHLKFNMAPEKLPSQKERIVFQPSLTLQGASTPSLTWNLKMISKFGI